MKRPIKFRGYDTTTGEFVYAELGEIMKTPDPGYLTFVPCEAYYVDIDSIAQLVGFDSDGREVYEGDIIVDDIAEYVAHLFANVRISDCKLKEALNENQQNSLAKLPGAR